jgi:tetratricopeptide (TPR) repeat protein
MQPEQHSERLLAASDTLRSGALERLLLDEAIAIADAVGDEPLAYGGRLRLISSCALSGDTEKRLAALDWCLARHLADPRRFPARTENLDLIWEFTTIPDAVASSTDFDRSVIVEALTTRRSLLERHGEGLSALRHAQVRVARIIGTDADRISAQHTLAGTPTDEYSPCPTCRQSEHALSLAENERFDEAAAAFDLLFDAPGSCAHEPELSYARSLSVYLQAGSPKKAARSHQIGYELIKHNPRHLALVARHIDYCRMVDHLDDGLALLERHLGWLLADPLNAHAQFEALIAMSALLDALVEAGRGATIIHGSEHITGTETSLSHLWGTDARQTGPHTAQSFAAVCWHAATVLANEFDERNRSTTYRERLAAGPMRPINLRPAVRARLAQSAPSEVSSIQASFASLAHDAPASDVWLQLARERATAEDAAGAESAIRWAHEALDQEQRGGAGHTGSHSATHPLNAESAQNQLSSAFLFGRAGLIEEPANPVRAGDSSLSTAGGLWFTDTGGTDNLGADNLSLSNLSITNLSAHGNTPSSSNTSRNNLHADPPAEQTRRRRVRAALFALEISLALERGDTEAAERLAGQRADVLIEDDRLDLAEVELQVGLLLFGAEQAAGSGTLEHALTSARKARVEAEAEVCILNALAEMRLKQGRPAEATAFMLTAVKLCGHDPDNVGVQRPLVMLAHAQVAEADFEGVKMTTNRLLRHPLDRATRANALLLRAAASHGLSQLNAGIADADRALSLYLELGYSKGIIDACARLALLLEELGVQAGVAEAWRHAVTEAERINHPEAGVIRFRLARALITAGHGAEAAAELDTVLENTVRLHASDTELSEVLYWLGHAFRLADNDELAYCSWSAALTRAAAAMDARACVRLGLALGRLLLDDNDESSIDVLTETVNQARTLDAPWELVDALHLLGQAQCEFDHPEGLRTFDEAVAVADQHSFDLDALLASITESKAHGLDALGRDAEALDTARLSARLYERLGERSSAGLVRLFAARMLTLAERTTEAQGEYQRSVELLAGDSAAAEVVSRELRQLTAPGD